MHMRNFIFTLIIVLASFSNSYGQSENYNFNEEWVACKKDADCVIIKGECDGPEAASIAKLNEFTAYIKMKRQMTEKSKEIFFKNRCGVWVGDPFEGARAFCVQIDKKMRCIVKYDKGKKPTIK